MPRITAESLMAPGGLLDESSRLTQTLLTVPFQREQIRARLDEKALMVKREDDIRKRGEQVNYLKDRIATNQQTIAELRRSLALGDKTEAAIALKKLKREGASKATLDIAQRVGDYESKLRQEIKDKFGEGFATAKTEEDIARKVDAFHKTEVERAKKLGTLQEDEGDAAFAALGKLKGIDLDLIKKDPQLQDELDRVLDQQSKLFDQYRELVGMAGDEVSARSFVQNQIPDFAPTQIDEGPSISPPISEDQHPDASFAQAQPPPMATLPYGDKSKGYADAIGQLDSPAIFGQAAQNADPAQLDAMALQQQSSAGMARLGKESQVLQDAATRGPQLGMPAPELAKIQAAAQAKSAAKRRVMATALSKAAFNGVTTPETIAVADKLLNTVNPSGQDMLFNEISGQAGVDEVNAMNLPGEVQSIPAQFNGPRITPQLIPRLRGMAPGNIPSMQNQQQLQDLRRGLDAQGLYPR